jgi:pimeloyl-ACP methyl ester carboxylesterase
MDALGISDAIIAGFDWGARTAKRRRRPWPGHCKAMVSVSGYLIGSPEANRAPLLPRAELAWWYQFYFATERGQAGYDQYRREFANLIWQTASPKWNFDDATFDRSAASFDNPDHVSIVIHNYRWRLGAAKGEAQYDDLENQLAGAPSSPCQRSPSKVMRMVRLIRSRPPIGQSSQASTRIGPSRAVSGTICRKRLRRLLSRPSSTSTATDR